MVSMFSKPPWFGSCAEKFIGNTFIVKCFPLRFSHVRGPEGLDLIVRQFRYGKVAAENFFALQGFCFSTAELPYLPP